MPMLEGCLENRRKWVEIEDGKEDKEKADEAGNAPEKIVVSTEF